MNHVLVRNDLQWSATGLQVVCKMACNCLGLPFINSTKTFRLVPNEVLSIASNESRSVAILFATGSANRTPLFQTMPKRGFELREQ